MATLTHSRSPPTITRAGMLSLDHEEGMLGLYMAAMLFCKCYEVCHGHEDSPSVEPSPAEQQQQQYVRDMLLGPPEQQQQGVREVLLGAAEAVRSASAEQQQQYVQAVDVLLGVAEAVRSASAEQQPDGQASQPG